MDNIKHLISLYNQRKPAIKKRLSEFRNIHKGKDEDLFHELCFCLLTPQSKAVHCDRAINGLKTAGLILKGNAGMIRPRLKGLARFHNKKAVYIVRARGTLKSGKRIDVKSKIDVKDVIATRDWFVENIKGLGYKEASHFLRNIGLGQDIAILDRHILKNLKKYGAISRIPVNIGSRKIYLELENKARTFSRKMGIPLEELDLLFWSMETGHIFK
jgi:N-glycosylase/DNA lyase